MMEWKDADTKQLRAKGLAKPEDKAKYEKLSDEYSLSVVTLFRYAMALSCKLEVKLVRKTRSVRNSVSLSNSCILRAA